MLSGWRGYSVQADKTSGGLGRGWLVKFKRRFRKGAGRERLAMKQLLLGKESWRNNRNVLKGFEEFMGFVIQHPSPAFRKISIAHPCFWSLCRNFGTQGYANVSVNIQLGLHKSEKSKLIMAQRMCVYTVDSQITQI